MTDANCDARPVTTVSPQSLMLMNYIGMREFSHYFAERLRRELPGDVDAQIERAWRLAFGRACRTDEKEAARELVDQQTAYYEQHPARLEYVLAPGEEGPAEPGLLALASLCQALTSANECLYID